MDTVDTLQESTQETSFECPMCREKHSGVYRETLRIEAENRWLINKVEQLEKELAATQSDLQELHCKTMRQVQKHIEQRELMKEQLEKFEFVKEALSKLVGISMSEPIEVLLERVQQKFHGFWGQNRSLKKLVRNSQHSDPQILLEQFKKKITQKNELIRHLQTALAEAYSTVKKSLH